MNKLWRMKMITGELKNKIDKIWEIFWTGGITNPLDVIEQFTYLLFIKQLDDVETTKENEANFLGFEYESMFPGDCQKYRWSKFKNLGSADEMYDLVLNGVFPFIKNLHQDGESAYSKYMGDAIFKIPTAAMLSKIVDGIDNLGIGDEKDTDTDSKGDLYEYLLSKVATAGTNGQFRTPRHIIKMMVELVQPNPDDVIIDPAMGSAGFLIEAQEYLRKYHEESFYDEAFKEHFANHMFYGNDMDRTMLRIGAMNMLLHGIKFSNFKIENGDTLEWDAFGDTQFDAVVANPPFSAEWSAADKFNNDDRFSKAGRLAPKKTADYAFILHMIYHLNEGGTMACVAPHGVLFRGNAEGIIRRFLIEKKNYIDAIIGLPANIFYGTSIPTCILVFKKCRKEDDNILFIDASKEFEKVKTQNKLRPQHIQKIVETYRDRKEIEKYSHLASLKEVADNDYNLNIPRYVDTFEEEEPIDIKAVMAEIKELEAKRAELDKEIEVYLKELGLVE